MRFIVLFMCVSAMQLTAAVYSQEVKVTLSVKDASFESVIRLLEANTEYTFLYEDRHIAEIGGLNLNFRDTDIKVVLDKCLQGTNLSYRLMNNHTIVIQRGVAVDTTKQKALQKMSVSGVVKDVKGEVLPGVTIRIKNTQLGFVTDIDGKFKFDFPKQDTVVLIFSFVGYKTQEFQVKNDKPITIVLKEDVTEMDEVVVTGIFTKAKESYTGAVTTITAKDLQRVGNRNLVSSIRNIDPSFNIADNIDIGSDPNKLPDITIRGSSSLGVGVKDLQEDSRSTQKANQPLFIMDGFEISLQKLMDFNDEEIESINILKDASATAIYGSRGANGVVVITTKVPTPGKLKMVASAGFSLEIPDLSSYNLLDAEEKLALEKEVGLYDVTGKDPHSAQQLEEQYYATLKEVLRGVDTYWLSKPLRTGVGQNYNVRLEGGSRELRWSAGISYNNIAGAMKGSVRNTFSGTINLAYTVKNLRFQNQTMLDYNNSSESKYGSFSQYTELNPYWTEKDEKGNYYKSFRTVLGNYVSNPLYDASLNVRDESKYNLVTNNFSIEWNVFQGLKLRGQIGISKRQGNSDVFKPAEHSTFNSTTEWAKPENFFKKGSYRWGYTESSSLESRVTASYSDVFKDKHQLYAGLDWSLVQSKSYSYSIFAQGFSNQDYDFFGNARQYAENDHPTGTESISRQVGFTGNVNYTYDNRYYADFSFRMDGSSQFGSDKRFAPFYSIGIGWNIHREHFMRNPDVINTLRLRMSYGKTGSQQFASYEALRTYEFYSDKRYMMWNGAELKGLGNKDLKWQVTDQYDVGIEIGLWNNRISGTFDVYKKQTNNLLSKMDLPLANGFDSYTANVGVVDNIGFEASVSGYVVRDTEREIIWMLTGKLAYTKNEIKKLSEAIKRQTERALHDNSEINNMLFEGDSQYAIYAVPSLGIDPSTGKELFLDADGNVTSVWNSSAKRYFGQTEPKFRGNFNSLFTYKNLTVNLNFGFRWGGQQYNQTLLSKVEVTNSAIQYNVDRRVWADRWQKPGDLKPFKGYGDEATKASSRFVMDERVFELQSASVSYRWQTPFISKLKLESINFDLNMSDVFYVSSIKRERGTNYPFARRMEFAIGLMF